VGIPRGRAPPPPRTRRQLACVATHLASAVRLRQVLDGRRPAPDGALTEAIFDRGGRIAHLAPAAQSRAARGRLAEAVRRMDRARGALRWTSPEEALSLWDALLDGRWSLVDHVDSDGRRFVLARRNPPGARDLRALAPQERAVLALAAEGRADTSSFDFNGNTLHFCNTSQQCTDIGCAQACASYAPGTATAGCGYDTQDQHDKCICYF
jgi:hypothetical protein